MAAQRAAYADMGRGVVAPVTPRLRRGDGRAEVVHLELLGQTGQPAAVLRSGELSVVRVQVRFRQPSPIRWWGCCFAAAQA